MEFPALTGVLPSAHGYVLILVSLQPASAAGEFSFPRDVQPIKAAGSA